VVPWTSLQGAAAELLSRDGATGLIVTGIGGGESDAQKYAKARSGTVAAEVVPRYHGVTVRAGGSAMVYSQTNDQTQRDLLVMESIALPLSFLVLVWVFGGLLAAALPMAVGALAIVGCGCCG
jgi:RND superfamily putative drug exporter